MESRARRNRDLKCSLSSTQPITGKDSLQRHVWHHVARCDDVTAATVFSLDYNRQMLDGAKSTLETNMNESPIQPRALSSPPQAIKSCLEIVVIRVRASAAHGLCHSALGHGSFLKTAWGLSHLLKVS